MNEQQRRRRSSKKTGSKDKCRAHLEKSGPCLQVIEQATAYRMELLRKEIEEEKTVLAVVSVGSGEDQLDPDGLLHPSSISLGRK